MIGLCRGGGLGLNCIREEVLGRGVVAGLCWGGRLGLVCVGAELRVSD